MWPRIAAAIALAALTLAGPARADDWPSKPITVIVPTAAGGSIDTLARILRPGLGAALGTQIVVENVDGADGMNGEKRIAQAAPDGYTIGFGNQGTHVFSHFLRKKVPYDSTEDFTPIGLVVSDSKVLVVRKSLQVNNLQEFIGYAKKHRNKMRFGSVDSAGHTACVLLNNKMGMSRVTHVPYRRASLAMQALVAGRIDYLCDITSMALPQIVSGTVRAIAILCDTRSLALPDVPTALEQGLADVDAAGWTALFAPAHTPERIVYAINVMTRRVLNEPMVQYRLRQLDLNLPPKSKRSPGYLSQLIKSDLAKWGPAIAAADIGKK
jgi:tripartite-type tricarboxylate transporter receptor subunit TctC